jgi:hypothetical protein
VANLAVISSTLSILGNIQGGNLLTSGVISTTGNATFGNVQTTGRITVTGNIDSGNVRTTGIVTATGNVSTAGFFVGDGGFISNITVAGSTKIVNGTSYANIAALNGNLVIVVGGNTIETITTTGSNITGYANVTGNVTGGNLLTAGLVSATSTITSAANITGGNITTAGVVTATGNVTSGNVLTAGIMSSTGNGIHGNILTAGLISATSNITGGNVLTGGLISATSTITSAANVTGGNITTAGLITATGNATAGNIRTAGTVTATGNVTTAGYFVGDGGFITNITGVTVTKIVNGTSWANIAASGGNLVIAIAGGTVGTISSGGANITGYANATGNVAGGNLVGQNLTPTRVTFVGSGKEIDDDAEFTYNDTTNTLSVGNISATGNVTAAFFNGNGSGLTGTVGGSRYYGQFWDTTTQNNGGATTANPMTFNTSDTFNTGVSITVGNTSHVVIANPGVYNLQFSAQFAKTDSGADTVSVWLAKDGVNVADSCTDLDLNNNNARSVAAWNWLVNPTVANTYYQIYWSSADTNMSIFAEGTRINPTRPAIPSVILTVTQA